MNKINASIVLSGLLWLAATGPVAKAQVSLYSYSESVETYTAITDADGGYSLGTPSYFPPLHNLRAWADPNNLDGTVTNGGYLQPAIGPGFPIGFDFTYNGDVFNRIGVAHGGWISFGKSSDGNQAVVVFTSDHTGGRPLSHSYWSTPLAHDYQRNRIAAWGNSSLRMMDLSPLMPPGPVSSLRVATTGTAPNRVCVIQWKDFRHSYDNPAGTRLNFQIRLYETSNTVEVRFGPTVWTDLGGEVQIGLGGRTNEDFNNRQTVYEQPAFLYDWNLTVRGQTNDASCFAVSTQPGQPNGSGIAPVAGRTFRWTAPACAPPAWPVTLSTLAFDGALASWPSTGSAAYDYFVSTENSITGPEAASGTVEDAEVYVEGLQPMTIYYLFVRSYCDGEPGEWGLGTPFRTHGGGYTACPGTPLQEVDFCANAQDATFYWHYVSDDGFSPVKIEFLSGLVGNSHIAIWNGNSATGTPALTLSGDLTGQVFTSSGPQLFIRLTTDAGSCGFQPWYLPLNWRAGCKNCTDPLATFSVVEDCENQEYSVVVDLFSLGTATSAILQNSQGVTGTTVTSTGNHTVGPFTAGTSVVVTVENAENAMCYSPSPALINAPCVVEDCGPTEYTLCYGDNDQLQRAYGGAAGQEIGIRFLQGTVGLGDVARWYNGVDLMVPTNLPTDLTNKLITSGAPSTDHAVVIELTADNAQSCADADTLFGASIEWKYVVACYDGCTQPRATFARSCISTTQYEVAVTITELGNTGSVTITNNGGAPSLTVTELGVYTVGPFTSNIPVVVEVEGASVLCTWTSSALNIDCTNIGMEELATAPLRLYPNPTNGAFRVELPVDMTGRTEVRVLDLAGRVVNEQVTSATQAISMDLAHLPNGLYTVVAFANGKRATAKISIQH